MIRKNIMEKTNKIHNRIATKFIDEVPQFVNESPQLLICNHGSLYKHNNSID